LISVSFTVCQLFDTSLSDRVNWIVFWRRRIKLIQVSSSYKLRLRIQHDLDLPP
jgi:hypothetical protein